MSIKMEKETILFNIIGYIYISLLALFCAVPFLLIISASFTEESSIYKYGFSLIPKEISTFAYQIIFKAPMQIINAYKISITITVVGTAVGLFVTAMTAYILYRKDFKYRNHFSFIFYFTTIFGGGLIPWYIMIVKYLHLKNTIFALILPIILNAWFIILMRNFMNSIPVSIIESAKIDGAGDFTIFLRLILPMSGPGLATIGLFIALGYWNNWFLAMLFIEKQELVPLQFYLYRLLSNINFFATVAAESGVPQPDLPSQSIKMAMAVVATGPIIFLYPFVQKYFVRGITIGAVKG